MAISLVDTAVPMNDTGYPVARAKHIWLDNDISLQKAIDDGLISGDSSVTLTQQEYEALTEEQKLDGLYYTYDTKRIYKNGVQYGASEPIQLTMEEYKALKEAGAIDEQQEYLVEADAEGILLGAEDIGYSNAVSNLPCTTVQGAVDKVAEKVDGLISDTDLTSTTSTLSASKVRSAVTHTFNTQDGKAKYLKLKLNSSTISIVDIYGGKIEILGANNSGANPDYKTVKVVRVSYGDWSSYDATQAPSALSAKIGSLYYYPTDNYYYLQLNNYANFTVTGATTIPEIVADLPADVSEMTLIPESDWGRIDDSKSSSSSTYSSATIDKKIAKHSLPLLYDTGMFTNTTVRVFKLANVLKEHASINFNNLNLLLSTRRGDEVEIATGKNDNDYWIQACRHFNSATKISAMYEDGVDVYIRLELYANFLRVYHKSGVLRDDFAVSEVDAIPDTATEVSIRPLPTYVTTRSLTLNSGYSGYITEVYDPTTKVVVYNVNINGTFKGLGNSIATGFKVPSTASSGADVIVSTIGIYGAVNTSTGDAQFTRLLIRNYSNPFLDVDAQGNYEISGTITYITV